MSKITIEFTDVNSKLLQSVVALLQKGKSVKAEEEDEADEEEEEVEEDEADEADEEEEEVEVTPKTGKATLEAVRTAAQKLISTGKTAKLKAILKTFGAAKVVDVPKTKWSAFITKCKAVK